MFAVYEKGTIAVNYQLLFQTLTCSLSLYIYICITIKID